MMGVVAATNAAIRKSASQADGLGRGSGFAEHSTNPPAHLLQRCAKSLIRLDVTFRRWEDGDDGIRHSHRVSDSR